jgi:hypothetical protein
VRDDWDVPRLTAWNKYSERHPPLHVLFAAYAGFKPPAKTEDPPDLLAFLAGVPGFTMKA